MKKFFTPILAVLLSFLPISVNAIVAQSDPVLIHEGEFCDLDWNSVSGRTYFVQYSFDLQTWSYLPTVEDGDGSLIGYSFDCGNQKIFLRLQYVDIPLPPGINSAADADFDGDGFNNYVEVVAGTSPFVPTTHDDEGEDADPPIGSAFRLDVLVTSNDFPGRREQYFLDKNFEIIRAKNVENPTVGDTYSFPLNLKTEANGLNIAVDLNALSGSTSYNRTFGFLNYEKGSSIPNGVVEEKHEFFELHIPMDATTSNIKNISGERFFSTDPGKRSLIPVEIQIRDDSQGKWIMTNELNVAKWEDAFNSQGFVGVHPEGDDGIGADVDRFRIRINTPSLPEDCRKFYLSSVGSDVEYVDDPTEIVLEYHDNPFGLSSGFISKPMILVADTVDNQFKNNNSQNDQTHIVALGNNVRFQAKSPFASTFGVTS